MSPDKPTPPESPGKQPPGSQPDALRENLDLEEFFQRLPSNLRWPKPNEEAVAAAVEAIQRLSASPEPNPPIVPLPLSDPADAETASCLGCGQTLDEGVRFCGHCGASTPGPAAETSARTQSQENGQHHYHHHYHHFVPAAGAGAMWPTAEGSAAASSPARPPASPGKSPTRNPAGSRAEQSARQLVQEWAQACNTRQLDDLLELYSADATVIRSNIPPVRSLIAIREFLFSLLEAGLGDVEMESLRTDVLGDMALELGRCKMLVPVAMGQRREERGKYLLVLVRQPSGGWKILADCWSSDLAVSSPAPDTARKPIEPAGPQRKPR